MAGDWIVEPDAGLTMSYGHRENKKVLKLS